MGRRPAVSREGEKTASGGLRLLVVLRPPGGQLLTSALVGTEQVLEQSCMGRTLLFGEYRCATPHASVSGGGGTRPETPPQCTPRRVGVTPPDQSDAAAPSAQSPARRRAGPSLHCGDAPPRHRRARRRRR